MNQGAKDKLRRRRKTGESRKQKLWISPLHKSLDGSLENNISEKGVYNASGKDPITPKFRLCSPLKLGGYCRHSYNGQGRPTNTQVQHGIMREYIPSNILDFVLGALRGGDVRDNSE